MIAREETTVAAQNDNQKYRRQAADQLREANEKLIKQLADHRLLEDVLRENSQVFRAILDTLPVAVSLAEDLKLTWANPAFMKIHGFESPNEYIGQSAEILFASRDEFERATQVVYSDLEIGNNAEISVKQKRKDGSIFDAHLQLSLFNDSDPAKRVVVCCTTDVSTKPESEDRLHKSDERYRASLEESFDGAVILRGPNILFANSSFSEMLGYSKEELEGMEYSNVLHPKYRELVTQQATARMRGESVLGYYEVKLLRKDRSFFDAEISARAIEMEGETCIQAWVRDVSERKRADEALQQSEERYRTLVEESFDGVSIYDGTKMEFVNSRLCEMLGYSKEELVGMDLLLTVHPDYRKLVCERAARRRREEAVPALYELKLLRKDGSSLDVETNARLIQVHGKPRVQAWIRDISERKSAETALRKSEERYRLLVEESFDGVMIHDGKKILFANSRLCEMLGYGKDELEGMDHLLTVQPDYRELITQRVADRQNGQSVTSLHGVKLQRKDGSSFDAEVNGRPIDIGGAFGLQVWIKDISERKKAEEALRDSEKKYRTVFNNAATAINLNRHGRILEANSACANMLGYSQDEIKRLNFRDVTHPDDLKITEQCHDELIRGEKDSCRFEKRYIGKDGRIVWADVWASAIRDETGEYQGGISAAIDITDRKEAEEALQRSEANYRAIFDSMNDAIFVHDIETGAIIDVNRKMCEMYGYAREEAIRLVAGEASFGRDKHSQALALQRIAMAARGEPQLFEWQAKAKDGRLFWVEVNLRKAVLNDNPYVLAVVRDITDRKWAEAERENERQKFQTLVDDAPFGIVMIRKDNTYEYVNPKFTEMFGYDLNDIPDGKHWLEKSWPDPGYRRKAAEAWLADVADMKQGIMKVRTFAVTCADGIQKMITLRSAQLHTGEFIITCEDITEQIRGEQERENLRQQLLHAQKMEALGTLVGGIAHDFNNLLTIILGYSELLLLEKGEDDPGKADLQKIIDAGSSGAALVQRMLTFSEQAESVLGPLTLNDEIENMKELLSRTIPKMISLELETAEDLALIDGDAGQVQQIIMNLALNGVEAMPNGGKLLIQTRNLTLEEQSCNSHSGVKPGNYVLLSVSDTGRGMSPEVMQRMYDPFFTTKNRDFVKGTGLGLAIVHGIVMAHGGNIICSSEPGKGTRFELYFPAMPYDKLIRDEQPDDSIAAVS
ncbi:MAG: PAS domain S-box protein [Desulfomonilaceae bacterium]